MEFTRDAFHPRLNYLEMGFVFIFANLRIQGDASADFLLSVGVASFVCERECQDVSSVGQVCNTRDGQTLNLWVG